MPIWDWFIRWWLGDEHQFGASMKARPAPTILKTLVVIALSLGVVWVVAFVSQKASNYAENKRVEEAKSRLGFSYKKTGETKDEATGKIKTTFELSIFIPTFFQPKNPDKGYNFVWQGSIEADCDEVGTPSESVADFGVTASTTRVHTAVCETYQYVIDNDRLWKLVEIE